MMILNPYRFSGGGAGDPYWSSVVALLHFDGADNSTTFTDETGKTWSPLGSPAIKTNQSLFGGASGYFAASAIEGPASADWAFGTGDFTVELWTRSIDLGTGGLYDAPVGNWSPNSGWCLFIRPDGKLQFQSNATSLVSGASVMLANIGQRIMASRASGVLYLFVDGSLVASAANTENLTRTDGIRIGGNRVGANDDFEGWIDELRITKGVGRKTSAYTLDATPFPNH